MTTPTYDDDNDLKSKSCAVAHTEYHSTKGDKLNEVSVKREASASAGLSKADA